MDNRNATATWSGFSHQGQVGLLVALRKTRFLMEADRADELASHFLEYESHEDVAIFKKIVDAEPEYLSVHQVKAYYSLGNNTKAKYTKVLNGEFDLCGNDFLHTVVNIDDWDTSATTNINDISRYEYLPDVYYCDTTEIETIIKDELSYFLENNNGKIVTAYNRLLFVLDQRIRVEHKKASKDLFDICFSLDSILTTVNDESDFTYQNLYNSRKSFYDLFCDFIKNRGIEEAHLVQITEKIIETIYGFEDQAFLTFLMRLNLNEKPSSLSIPQFNFNPTGLKQVFYKILFEVQKTFPKLENKSVKYFKKGNPEHFILTSIIEEMSEKETVVKNIICNLESQNILWENHALINKEINGNLFDLNPNIKNIKVVNEESKEKFMSFSKKSRLIDREEAKKILNDE